MQHGQAHQHRVQTSQRTFSSTPEWAQKVIMEAGYALNMLFSFSV
jgi:hypothetical protein